VRVILGHTFFTHFHRAVRKYHSEYYVPHNLSLIVSGKVDTRALLDALQTHVEPSAIAHGQTHGPRGPPGFARPFVGTPSANRPPHTETVKHTTEFPERDESMGEVYISFRGSKCGDFITNGALDIIGSYLTSTATSPLNRDLVEIPSPLWYVRKAHVQDYLILIETLQRTNLDVRDGQGSCE